MRPKAWIAGGIILLPLVTGCTDSPGATQGEKTPVSASSSPGEPGPALKLEQVRGKKLLVEETEGKAGVDLPVFQPPQASYTVHFVCSGSGEISLEVDGKKWISHPCDGVENAAERITEKEPQAVSIKLSGTALWKVAVADGPL